MMGLSHHATHGAHKDNIRGHSRATSGAIEGVALNTDCKTAQDNRSAKDTIVASNQTNVVLVESQAVLFSEYQGSGRGGWSRADTHLETQARDGAGFFSHFAWLEATAASVISLAAFIVLPATARVDVIQDFFAHVHLTAQTTEH